MTIRTRCLDVMFCLGLASGVSMAQTPPPSVDKAVKTGQDVVKTGQEITKAGQDAAKKIQSAGMTKPTTIVATVEAIDQSTRMVSLKGPQGNVVDVYVDDSHKGFDTLKVGDAINATYYESVVVHVRKEGEPAPTTGDTAAVTPRPGGGGGTIARQVVATVTIKAIDAAVPSVTVEDPKGRVLSMRVQDPKRLEGVKVGDTIDVTYTQALLLGLGK